MDLFGKGRYIFKGSREAHGCVNCILLNGGPQCKKQINNCKHLIIPWLLIPVPPNIATPPPVWKMWRTNASGSKNLSGTRACSSSVSNVGLVKLYFYSRRQLFIKRFLSWGWFLFSVEQQRETEKFWSLAAPLKRIAWRFSCRTIWCSSLFALWSFCLLSLNSTTKTFISPTPPVFLFFLLVLASCFCFNSSGWGDERAWMLQSRAQSWGKPPQEILILFEQRP